MPYHVFISHSSKDKPAADALCNAIEAAGWRCWIAPRDIVAGTDWSEAIVAALIECPAVVLVFSENSNASDQVKREVQRSFEKKKVVVPVRIDDVMPSGAMEYYLGPVHWLTAPRGDTSVVIDLVVDALRLQVPVEALTSPPTPPRGGEASVPASAGNLPEAPAAYVGRQAELDAWEAMVRAGSARILTLVGFGGMGKTRSSLELGHRVKDAFPQGVWWVPLEEAHTAQDAWLRIAQALPLILSPSDSAKDKLIAYLKTRKMLLILDNLEQIPDADVCVRDLATATPDVQFLVTSRKALELAEEQTIEVPPLPRGDAVALFVDRARAREATFALTPDNQADVAAICDRLDGMPLAIELAAARVTAMTPRDILARLGEWTRVLQSRAPHLPPRQRAMQGAIEWSHDLLGDEDKELFAQLAVFADGFTLVAAENVCDTLDVFEGVHELRRHSFLRSQTLPVTQQMRFFMLELVREYAHDRLTADTPDASADIQVRHARFFLKFVAERSKRLRTDKEAVALAELQEEIGNLRAAVETARSTDDKRLLIDLAQVVGPVLEPLGYWREAQSLLEEAITAAAAVGDPAATIARLRLELAGVVLDLGDAAQARSLAESASELFEADSSSDAWPRAANLVGLANIELGDLDAAHDILTRALERWPADAPGGRALALHNLALVATRRDDLEQARVLYDEALAARRAAGDRRGEAETLGNLGAVAFRAGDTVRAAIGYRDSLDIRRSLNDRVGIAVTIYNLAELADDRGRPDAAAGLYAHALTIFDEIGSPFAAAAHEQIDALRARLGEDAVAAAIQTAREQSWGKAIEGDLG